MVLALLVKLITSEVTLCLLMLLLLLPSSFWTLSWTAKNPGTWHRTYPFKKKHAPNNAAARNMPPSWSKQKSQKWCTIKKNTKPPNCCYSAKVIWSTQFVCERFSTLNNKMTQNLLLSATHKIPKPNHARQNSTNWNITHRESLQCNHWNLTHRRSSLNLMVAAPFAIPMGGTPSGTGSSLQKKTSCLQNFKAMKTICNISTYLKLPFGRWR